MKLLLLVIYNSIRITWLKLCHPRCAHLNWLQRISPWCRLKQFEKGYLKIGCNCQFEAGCDLQVHGQGRLIVGQRVYMNRYCMVSAHGSVEIGDNCIFGPGVKIFDNNHKFDKMNGVKTNLSIGSVKIGKNCWIASNTIILKGADIGDHCVIGAGCIVKEKIPSGSLVRPNCRNTIEKIRK